MCKYTFIIRYYAIDWVKRKYFCRPCCYSIVFLEGWNTYPICYPNICWHSWLKNQWKCVQQTKSVMVYIYIPLYSKTSKILKKYNCSIFNILQYFVNVMAVSVHPSTTNPEYCYHGLLNVIVYRRGNQKWIIADLFVPLLIFQ